MRASGWFRRRSSRLIALALGAWLALACLPAGAAPARPGDRQRASAAFASLMRGYDPTTGGWRGEGGWTAANSVSIVARWMMASPPAPHAVSALATTFAAAQRGIGPGGSRRGPFLDGFYDDEGWWALAWIDAFEATGRADYLAAARTIFADMQTVWDDTCGGGLWWNRQRHYKNAITNELFLSVAARLAGHATGVERAADLDWARREWAWFNASGLINARNLVNDGLNAACRNNNGPTWTYNQGVILGGLTALSAATGDRALLDRANAIAGATLATHTDVGGVLLEAGRPRCGGDVIAFKISFVRNLATLDRATPDPRYARFFAVNADAVWTLARTPDDRFSCSWTGPAEDAGAAATTSALAPLLAVLGTGGTGQGGQ